MIVGTAGHIDHGKSTLIQALSGTDPSRLAEEKRRGISIELGYAFLDTASGERIGFIDVPGHERLVHTMLAGATGLDAVMLLIAADDGVMPQTREHLAIISMLGIEHGIVVVSKTDRVPAERVAAVCDEARRLLAPTTLAHAAIVAVSAINGDGLDDVRRWLDEQACASTHSRAGSSTLHFGARLAIDRAFTLDGIGTVVTGTVFAGALAAGDELCVVPGETPTRARSLRAQNRTTERATRGQRCAVNVAGLAKQTIARGSWLCDPQVALQTGRIDIALSLWHAEDKPLRSGSTVHVHVGAADVMARVVVLDGDRVALGATHLVQLILRSPIAVWRGDRVILRDASASRTIAGGPVLDPFAPARYRSTPQRLGALRACQASTSQSRFAAALTLAAGGIALDRWLLAEGLSRDDGPALAAGTQARLLQMGRGDGHLSWAITDEAWQRLQSRLIDAIRRFHDDEPQAIGVDAARLRRLAAPRIDAAVVAQAIASLLDDKRLSRHGAFLHHPDHGVTLAPAEARLAERLMPLIDQGGFDPPWVRDLSKTLNVPETQVRQTLSRLAISGQLFQVVRDLYYSSAAIERLAALVRELHEASSIGVPAAAFRDRTGLGRKRAIQILEFFDRVGLLRRVRDAHVLRPGNELFLPGQGRQH